MVSGEPKGGAMRYIFIALWLAGCVVDVLLFLGTVFLLMAGGFDGPGGDEYLVGAAALLGAFVLVTGILWSLAGKLFPELWPR